MRRWWIGLALVAVLAAAAAAPLLAGAASPAAFPLYAAFSWICHQRPERCWHLAGYPLAVCVRCLGLYAGALAGAVGGRRFSRRLFVVSLALLGAEWLAEFSGWLDAGLAARFATGFATGFFLVPALWGEQRDSTIRSKWIRREVRA